LLYKEANPKQIILVIFATRAFRILKKGCSVYLCAVESAETQEPDTREISIVQEFLGIFQKVSGLPPDREIEFMIKLVPGTTLISKASYRMAPIELKLNYKSY